MADSARPGGVRYCPIGLGVMLVMNTTIPSLVCLVCDELRWLIFGQSIAGIDQVVLQIVGLRLQQLHYQLRRSLFLSISLSSTPSPAEPHLFISGPHAGVSTSHFHFSLPDWLRNGGCFQTDKLSPFPPFKVIETLLSLPIASISFIVICFCVISFPL